MIISDTKLPIFQKLKFIISETKTLLFQKLQYYYFRNQVIISLLRVNNIPIQERVLKKTNQYSDANIARNIYQYSASDKEAVLIIIQIQKISCINQSVCRLRCRHRIINIVGPIFQ